MIIGKAGSTRKITPATNRLNWISTAVKTAAAASSSGKTTPTLAVADAFLDQRKISAFPEFRRANVRRP